MTTATSLRAASATASARRASTSAASGSAAIEKPCAVATNSSPAFAAISRGRSSTRVGLMSDEPAPWKRGLSTKAPMSATERCGASGSRSPSFLSSTMPRPAASRASAWWASTSRGPWNRPAPSVALRTRSSTRPAATSSVDSGSEPSPTAATSCASVTPLDVGISRSIPDASEGTRSLTAPQSDTTSPSKPHSSRRTDVSSHGSSDA